MKRLELKVELNKKSANLSKRSKFKDKFLFLVNTLLIFIKANFMHIQKKPFQIYINNTNLD